MPRNGSGTFSLVSGNPVVSGTTIESNWANTTLSDIATTLTDSLSRSGQGGMTAALRIADGTQGAPGVGFANETGSGFYRAGTGEVWAVVQGAQTLNLDANGVYVPADKTTTVDGAFVFNEAGADKDARFEGDTDANLLFTDASTDRVGIGTATPASKLDVVGDVTVSGAVNAATVNATTLDLTNLEVTNIKAKDGTASMTLADATGVATFSANPILNAGTANGVLYLNGSKVATSGSALTFDGQTLTNTRDTPILNLNDTAASNVALRLLSTGGITYIQSGISAGAFAPIAFTANGGGSERMRLDSSGNLGLGVTPSAWASQPAIQQTGGALWGVNAANYEVLQNAFYNGTNYIYRNTNLASRYNQNAGVHSWYTAPSGTAGNAISFTQAMTLDASGNLLVGTTSGTDPEGLGSPYINVKGAVYAFKSTDTTKYVAIGAAGTAGYVIAQSGLDSLRLYAGGNERARITSGGYFKASNNGTYTGSTATYHESYNSQSNYTHVFTNANASPVGLLLLHSTDSNGIANEFWYCQGASTQRASLRSNGGLANYSGNNVNLSDRREKTNFAPAKPYLDTICAIPVQTFEYIDQSPDDPGLTLGVVAQDVQAVAPELVMESNWGTADNPKMRLSIYQTDLQYALMKCIQEQQALITALTARVAALEAQP